jgi:threonine dehydrogenase-like Zn-dependent dehydrogenase
LTRSDTAPQKARSLYFEEPRNVRVREEAVTPADGELLLRSERIGISHGTEMLFFNGPFPKGQLEEARSDVGAATDYPIKYGYMNVGHTESGERYFGFVPHQDWFTGSPDSLLAVPEGVDTEDAVLYPSVETAVQICHDAAPRLGERVVIAGLGVIGLLLVDLMIRMEVDVVALDPVAERRARAVQKGALVLDPRAGECRAQIREATRGRGLDIGINVSANPDALQLLIDAAAIEATVVEASWYGEKTVPLSLGAAFHRRRLTVRASQVSHLNPAMQPRWNRARRSELTWKLMPNLRPSQYITHRIPLEQAAEAYNLIAARDPAVLQIVLIP